MTDRWVSPDHDPRAYEREVLYRLGEIEKRLAIIEERMDEFRERVHLIEVSQAQVKMVAVIFATMTGVISTIVGKLWR